MASPPQGHIVVVEERVPAVEVRGGHFVDGVASQDHVFGGDGRGGFGEVAVEEGGARGEFAEVEGRLVEEVAFVAVAVAVAVAVVFLVIVVVIGIEVVVVGVVVVHGVIHVAVPHAIVHATVAIVVVVIVVVRRQSTVARGRRHPTASRCTRWSSEGREGRKRRCQEGSDDDAGTARHYNENSVAMS